MNRVAFYYITTAVLSTALTPPAHAQIQGGDLVLVSDGYFAAGWASGAGVTTPDTPSYVFRIDLSGVFFDQLPHDPLSVDTSRTSVIVGPTTARGFHAISALDTGNFVLLEQIYTGGPSYLAADITLRSPDGTLLSTLVSGLPHQWFTFSTGVFIDGPTGHLFAVSDYWDAMTTSPWPQVPADGRSKMFEFDSNGTLVRYYNGDPMGEPAWKPDGAAINPATGELLVTSWTESGIHRYSRDGSVGTFLGRIDAPTALLSGLAIHPKDGHIFVSTFFGSYAEPSVIHEFTATGEWIRTFDLGSAVQATMTYGPQFGGLAFDPSGRFLAAADFHNDEVVILDAESLTMDNRRPVVARYGSDIPLGSVGFSFSSISFATVTDPATGCGLPGDVNASGTVNVVDVQCIIQVSLWSYLGNIGPAPSCALPGPSAADLDCSTTFTVKDVQIGILLALQSPLPSVLDTDKNGCIDTCEN